MPWLLLDIRHPSSLDVLHRDAIDVFSMVMANAMVHVLDVINRLQLAVVPSRVGVVEVSDQAASGLVKGNGSIRV